MPAEEITLVTTEFLMINKRHDIVEPTVNIGINGISRLSTSMPSRHAIIVELSKRNDILGEVDHGSCKSRKRSMMMNLLLLRLLLLTPKVIMLIHDNRLIPVPGWRSRERSELRLRLTCIAVRVWVIRRRRKKKLRLLLLLRRSVDIWRIEHTRLLLLLVLG